jgi:hypothetical protein
MSCKEYELLKSSMKPMSIYSTRSFINRGLRAVSIVKPHQRAQTEIVSGAN